MECREYRKYVVIRNASGFLYQPNLKQVRIFGMYEQQMIKRSSDDKLLFGANRCEPSFRAVNSELATVSRVHAEGRIELEDAAPCHPTTGRSRMAMRLPPTVASASPSIKSSFRPTT